MSLLIFRHCQGRHHSSVINSYFFLFFFFNGGSIYGKSIIGKKARQMYVVRWVGGERVRETHKEKESQEDTSSSRSTHPVQVVWGMRSIWRWLPSGRTPPTQRKKNKPLAFNKTHLQWANSSPLSPYPPPLDLLLALYHFPITLDRACVIWLLKYFQ